MNAVDRMLVRGAFTDVQAGLYLGKGKGFIKQLIEDGEIAYTRLGNTLLIPRFVLDDYLTRKLIRKPKAIKRSA